MQCELSNYDIYELRTFSHLSTKNKEKKKHIQNIVYKINDYFSLSQTTYRQKYTIPKIP